MLHALLLFVPGVLGGMINAMAGGGGIIMYPALLGSGLSPLIANATSTPVPLAGSITSAIGYRKDIAKVPRIFLWLMAPCLFGSVIGSYILVHTSSASFEKLAPWLVLSAVLLVALQSRIHKLLMRQRKKRHIHWHTMPLIYLGAFIISIYGGFFGVGFGLMMLALLGFSGLKNIHQMNGIKNLTGCATAFVATIYFWHAGLINWHAALIMATGTAIGGYLGARFAHKISTHLVHNLTVVIGLIIAVILIIRS